MKLQNDPVEWAMQAEGDLKMAYSGLRRKEPILFAACFHAQQCAEKYLKALLVSRDHVFPKTHDLLELTRLCEAAKIIVPIDPDNLDRLNDYAVTKRYPSEGPTIEETVGAIATAREVRKFARKFLNLTQGGSPAT